MKLEVYYSDPNREKQQLIQVFKLKDGVAIATKPAADDWIGSVHDKFGRQVKPDDGEAFIEALHDKLGSSTYMTSVISE